MKAFLFLVEGRRNDNRKVLKCQLGLKYVYNASGWRWWYTLYVNELSKCDRNLNVLGQNSLKENCDRVSIGDVCICF